MKVTPRQCTLVFLGFSLACGVARADDDKSTIGAAMEMFGYSTEPSTGSIDYRERARVVLPPKQGALPAPVEKTAEIDGWPRDPGGAHKRNSDRYAKIQNAPAPEKKPGLLERLRGPKPEAAPGTDDEPGLLQRIITRRQGKQTLTMEEPARRMLTDPPAGYRQPTMDLNAVGDGSKKTSWLNPFGVMGKSDENDPVAETGASQQAEPQSTGKSGFLSRMLPSFMKGSEN